MTIKCIGTYTYVYLFICSALQPKSSEQTESFLIRLTFNGKNIGESSKASERSEDGGSILFDFVASVELPCSSQKDISEIIKSPLVGTYVRTCMQT